MYTMVYALYYIYYNCMYYIVHTLLYVVYISLHILLECGSGFTNKLEGMFKDMDLSRDIMVSFKQYMESREAPGGIDLTVNVLMLSYWPSYPPITVNLLPEVCRVTCYSALID